jgi:hypothetical protein
METAHTIPLSALSEPLNLEPTPLHNSPNRLYACPSVSAKSNKALNIILSSLARIRSTLSAGCAEIDKQLTQPKRKIIAAFNPNLFIASKLLKNFHLLLNSEIAKSKINQTGNRHDLIHSNEKHITQQKEFITTCSSIFL